MDYIKVEGNKVDLMRTMVQFTSSGKSVDNALRFIDNNKHILSNGERVSIVKQPQDLLMPGVKTSKGKVRGTRITTNRYDATKLPYRGIDIRNVVNWAPMDAKYHINIKKTTIILILFLLDTNITMGVANLLAGVFGVTTATINSLNELERCLVLDVLVGKKRTPNDFLYLGNECVQNDIECQCRKNSVCTRNLAEINDSLARLQDIGVIVQRSGLYKLAF